MKRIRLVLFLAFALGVWLHPSAWAIQTDGGAGSISATNPITWADGDIINIQLDYNL